MESRSYVPLPDDMPASTARATYQAIGLRKNKIELNRRFQGFFEFLNQSNFLATAVEFFTRPTAEVFSSLWFVKWVNAPIAIVANFFLSLIAIRNAHLKKDAFSIANAAVVVATSAALIAGAIGIAAGIAAMAFVAPLLITAAILTKSLWDLGTAIVYGIKAACTSDEDFKIAHRNRALSALVDGLAGSLLTGAMVAITLIATPLVQTILMGVAIGATAIGVISACAKFAWARRHAKGEENALLAAEEGRSSTCCINSALEHDRNESPVKPTPLLDHEPLDVGATSEEKLAESPQVTPQASDDENPSLSMRR